MTITATRARPLPATPKAPPGRTGRTGRDLWAAAVGVVVISSASCWLLGLPTSHVLQAAALYAVLAALIVRGLPAVHPGPGIGAGNRVTLGRSTLVLAVAALALRNEPLGDAGYWWILALSTLAMALDGVDGRVARRTGSTGAFGARFDMEVDAFLLMALSTLIWQSGKVGAWVLLIGALRYLFVLGGLAWAPLRRELPASFRRKAVCVVQGVTLIVCVAPIVPAAFATGAAAIALALLTTSFAVDVRWLARR